MLRVWILALGLMIGCVIVYLLAGFMGVVTLKFASALLGAGAAAAYLPGNNSISRGLFLLLGVIFGSLAFLLGAVAFPDTNVGLGLGAIVPILFSALAATFTRSPETLLVMLLGAGSMGALYTTDFFTDPQSINHTLPIAIGQVMVGVALGYLIGVLAHTFGGQPAETGANPAVAKPGPDDTGDSVDDSDEVFHSLDSDDNATREIPQAVS